MSVEHTVKHNPNILDGWLTGKLLIASPSMKDFRFSQSVLYICSHSRHGALGLIINRPSVLSFDMILQQLSLEEHRKKADSALEAKNIRVYQGGPVEMERGFILHSSDYKNKTSTVMIDDDVSLTMTQDILEDISIGSGPEKGMFMLGYAGWGARQLEKELAENDWLVSHARADIIFHDKDDDKWSMALEMLTHHAHPFIGQGGEA